MTDARAWLATIPRQHTYTDSARMADTLLAVLDLHTREYDSDHPGDGSWCAHCVSLDDLGEHSSVWQWPCQTVQIINRTLEESS